MNTDQFKKLTFRKRKNQCILLSCCIKDLKDKLPILSPDYKAQNTRVIKKQLEEPNKENKTEKNVNEFIY